MTQNREKNGTLPSTFGALDEAEHTLLSAVRDRILDPALRGKFDHTVTKLNDDATAKVKTFVEIFFTRHKKELLQLLSEAGVTVGVDANGHIAKNGNAEKTLQPDTIATAIASMYMKKGKQTEPHGNAGRNAG